MKHVEMRFKENELGRGKRERACKQKGEDNLFEK